MGFIETYVNLRNYDCFDVKAYQLQRDEANNCLEALQRMMPKKAIDISEGSATSSGLCPSCGKELIYVSKNDNANKRNFCRYCGQCVDWFLG